MTEEGTGADFARGILAWHQPPSPSLPHAPGLRRCTRFSAHATRRTHRHALSRRTISLAEEPLQMPAPLAHKNERAAVRPIEIEQRQARGVHFAFTFVEVVLPQCEHVTVLSAISYS